MDFSLNTVLRNTVARTCGDFTIRFCRAVRGNTVTKKLEDAFLTHLSDYADYTLLGNGRESLRCGKIVESTIARAYELSRKDINKGLDHRLSHSETLVLFDIAWKGSDFDTEELNGAIPALVKLSYIKETGSGWCATVMGRDRLSAMTRAATKRPRNFHSLPEHEQCAFNRELGIVGWEAPAAIKENILPNPTFCLS